MTRCLENKLEIDFGKGKHPTGWYFLDGKKILRVTNLKSHGGSSLSIGVATRIKNSLKLNSRELIDLYNCPMSGRDFENKIRNMGLL